MKKVFFVLFLIGCEDFLDQFYHEELFSPYNYFSCSDGLDDDNDGFIDRCRSPFEYETFENTLYTIEGNTANFEGEWVLINGGDFMMGSEDGESDEEPVHSVSVRDFYMSKTEVTVGQYRKCVEAGVCSKANSCDYGDSPNWSDSVGSKENHPINCVNWIQARVFAKWVGGDLPSESQWEYASRSGGRDITYPWGNTEPTCELANYDGCVGETTPVCSKTGGNTEQRLCDMGGNVREWVLDENFYSYSGAPADDSGWCSDRGCSSNTSAHRVYRGGSWYGDASLLRSANRDYDFPRYRLDYLGFRVSRSLSEVENTLHNIEGNTANLEGEWVLINGGNVIMGSEDGESDEQPVHSVNVRDFYMSKTEVTVGQYRKCVEAGVCSEPDSCNWSSSVGEKENHPINCVDWMQAREFAKWVGGDLPSEAQWEYASRSGGRDIKYPWGNEEASCEYAVMGNPNNSQDESMWGCGQRGTWGVCSKTGGNTAQGLCDMGGNVWEWVLDEYHDSYSGAPADDSGWCSWGCSSITSADRVYRGGSWFNDASYLRSAFRGLNSPGYRSDNLGFRVSRSVN